MFIFSNTQKERGKICWDWMVVEMNLQHVLWQQDMILYQKYMGLVIILLLNVIMWLFLQKTVCRWYFQSLVKILCMLTFVFGFLFFFNFFVFFSLFFALCLFFCLRTFGFCFLFFSFCDIRCIIIICTKYW